MSNLNEVEGISLGDFTPDSALKKIDGRAIALPMFGVDTPLFGFFNEFSLEMFPTNAENVGTDDSPNYQPVTLELQTEFTVVHHYVQAPKTPEGFDVADAESPVVQTTLPS